MLQKNEEKNVEYKELLGGVVNELTKMDNKELILLRGVAVGLNLRKETEKK